MNLEEIVRNALTRRSLPLFDERVLVNRIARKVERVCERLGVMPSPGAQALLRCNGVLRYDFGKLVVETGACAVVEAIPPTEVKELVN